MNCWSCIIFNKKILTTMKAKWYDSKALDFFVLPLAKTTKLVNVMHHSRAFMNILREFKAKFTVNFVVKPSNGFTGENFNILTNGSIKTKVKFHFVTMIYWPCSRRRERMRRTFVLADLEHQKNKNNNKNKNGAENSTRRLPARVTTGDFCQHDSQLKCLTRNCIWNLLL